MVDAAHSPASSFVTAPNGHRRKDIQGLRAIAVLMVVGFHAGLPMPGGFAGVDVFFVISGFVITGMLHREWLETGRIRFGQFYLRRFRRLTPALALMLTIVVASAALFVSPLGGRQMDVLMTAAAAIMLVANFVISAITGGYFDAPAEMNPLLHTWSLSIEEQFYLFFPGLLLLAWLLGRRRGWTWAPALTIAALALLSAGLAISGQEAPDHFYSPFGRAWEFAVGALLALGLTPQRSLRVSARTLRWLGCAALILSVFVISGDQPFPGPLTALPVGGAALVIASGGTSQDASSRWLSHPLLVRVGDLSYSWYLWHWPLIVFARALWPHTPIALPIAAALSVIPAALSYHYVEGPCRRRLPSRSRTAMVGVMVTTLPLLACLGLLRLTVDGYGSPTVRHQQEIVAAQHASQTAGCSLESGGSEWPARNCTWNSDAQGAGIYLIGDSHAEHFSDAVIEAGGSLGRPVVVGTHGSCPPIAAVVWDAKQTSAWNRHCMATRDHIIAAISNSPAALVIFAASDKYTDEGRYLVGPDAEHLSGTRAGKLSAWRLGLESMVRQLQGVGHRVVLVQTVPRWTSVDDWYTTGCLIPTLFSTSSSCSHEMPVARAAERQGDVRRLMQNTSTVTGAELVDLWPRFCGITCGTNDPGYLRYRDSEHITVAQSVALAPDFVAAIRAAG